MSDLYENILNSISLVANSKAQELQYNTTIIGIILEVTDKLNGKYLVTDSTSKFYAYAYNDTVYSVDDVVYVTIPNSNYNQKKWILGLASADDNSVYKSIIPEDGFSQITFNKTLDEEFGILANGETESIVLFESEDKIDSKGQWYLCIAGDFNVSIPNCNEGTFGLKFTFNTNQEEALQISYTLDSSSMTGPFYSQDATQAIYYIMKEYDLDGYRIELYQNNDFLYEDGTSITYEGMNNQNYINIKVYNTKILIGEVADIEEQFSDIHYSQIENNGGFIIGKNQTLAGMFTYDEKKIISAFTSNGEASIGNESIGILEAQKDETNLNGDITFDINNTLITDEEGLLHINDIYIEEQGIINSKEAFEENIFTDYFDIKWRSNASIVSNKSISYYIDFDSGKDDNDGSQDNPFLSFEPIKRILQAHPSEIKVYLVSDGELNWSDIYSLNDISLTINASNEVYWINILLPEDEDFYFNDCNITFSGGQDYCFNFNTSNFIYFNGGNYNLTNLNFFDNIYLQNTTANFKKTYFSPINGLNSKLYIDNSYLDGMSFINSNVYLNNNHYNNSNIEAETNESDGHCYEKNSNITFNGLCKASIYAEEKSKKYYWYCEGGHLSFLSRLIGDSSTSRQYTTVETTTTVASGSSGATYLANFKTYVASIGGMIGDGQCGTGVSGYSSWLGHGIISGNWAWDMYTNKSWASWASEISVDERQPGDIAFWSSQHTAIVDNDISYYYGQNQGYNNAGGPFNSVPLGAPSAVIRPNEFSNGSLSSTSKALAYESNPNKYENFMSCNGTVLTSTGEIMQSWCVLVNASIYDCYKIEYNDYIVNEDIVYTDEEFEATYEGAVAAIKDFIKNKAGWTSEISDETIQAIFMLCDYEGYSEDLEFASYMAATALNRLMGNNGMGANEFLRAWGGGATNYNWSNFSSIFASREIRDFVYQTITTAINNWDDNTYGKAYYCHGECQENRWSHGQYSSNAIIFRYFSGEGMWFGIWPRDAVWY